MENEPCTSRKQIFPNNDDDVIVISDDDDEEESRPKVKTARVSGEKRKRARAGTSKFKVVPKTNQIKARRRSSKTAKPSKNATSKSSQVIKLKNNGTTLMCWKLFNNEIVTLDCGIERLSGIGDVTARLLRKNGFKTISDLKKKQVMESKSKKGFVKWMRKYTKSNYARECDIDLDVIPSSALREVKKEKDPNPLSQITIECGSGNKKVRESGPQESVKPKKAVFTQTEAKESNEEKFHDEIDLGNDGFSNKRSDTDRRNLDSIAQSANDLTAMPQESTADKYQRDSKTISKPMKETLNTNSEPIASTSGCQSNFGHTNCIGVKSNLNSPIPTNSSVEPADGNLTKPEEIPTDTRPKDCECILKLASELMKTKSTPEMLDKCQSDLISQLVQSFSEIFCKTLQTISTNAREKSPEVVAESSQSSTNFESKGNYEGPKPNSAQTPAKTPLPQILSIETLAEHTVPRDSDEITVLFQSFKSAGSDQHRLSRACDSTTVNDTPQNSAQHTKGGLNFIENGKSVSISRQEKCPKNSRKIERKKGKRINSRSRKLPNGNTVTPGSNPQKLTGISEEASRLLRKLDIKTIQSLITKKRNKKQHFKVWLVLCIKLTPEEADAVIEDLNGLRWRFSRKIKGYL